MNTFSLNGKEYIAQAFDFNLICELEDMGVTMDNMDNKAMNFIRAYVSKCMGASVHTAGYEINAHIVGGGKLDGIFDVLSSEMEKSDFFRALSQETEEKTTTKTSKAKTSK